MEKILFETPIWNRADLTPPPVCTVKSKWGKDIIILNSVLKKIITTLESFDIMLYETKLLSAIIKQYKSDLRTDKSFQLVNKVIHCLKRCQKLNIKEVFLNFEKTSTQCTAFDYQPSRQMLEYVLVRIQGFTMLLKNLVGLCHDSALHLRAKMEIGHFPSIVLTFFSVVSRIWSLSKYFIENAFEWYQLLLPLQQVLQPTQVDWLPSGYKFPALPFEFKQAPWINENKILKSLSSFLSDFKEPAAPSTNMEYLTKTDDLGETITRQDLALLRRAEPRNQVENKQKTHLQENPSDPKPGSTLKSARTVPDVNSGKRKRKLSDSEPKRRDSGTEGEPVKHFFNKKYSRPLVLGDPRVKTVGTNYVKITKVKPCTLEGNTAVDSTNIMQELVRLKEDLKNFGEKSGVQSKSAGLNPKYKRTVVVVQDEPSVSNKSRIEMKPQKPSPVLKKRKQNKTDGKIGGSNSARVDSTKADDVKNRAGGRDFVVPSGPSKEVVSRKLVKKRKQIAKLKKLKSKSWNVIQENGRV